MQEKQYVTATAVGTANNKRRLSVSLQEEGEVRALSVTFPMTFTPLCVNQQTLTLHSNTTSPKNPETHSLDFHKWLKIES